MKAIVLAAGQGTRLRPFTDDRPKCMVPYRGRPLLEYALDAFKSCGIGEVVVVCGYMAGAVAANGIQKRMNPAFERTNMVETLFSAEDELDTDVVVSYGDIIYRAEVLAKLLASPDGFSVAIDKDWRALWEARGKDPLTDAETLKMNAAGFITEVGRKPGSLDEIEGQYMGLFKINETAVAAVREFYHSLDREALYDGLPFHKMYMTTFIQRIIDHLMPVKAVPIRGGWLEVDDRDDLRVDIQI